jgi:hypothetical protein
MFAFQKSARTKALTRVALVSLSGFVPVPLIVHTARAASATISFQGSLITGVQIGPGINVQFGKLVATGPNGSMIINPGGGFGSTKGVTAGGAPQAGSFTFKAVNSTGPIDVTVKGLGPVTLAATPGGGGPVGTAKLSKVIIGGIGPAPLVMTATAGGVATAKNYGLSTKNGPMEIGIGVTWGAVQPIGSFTQQIIMRVTF